MGKYAVKPLKYVSPTGESSAKAINMVSPPGKYAVKPIKGFSPEGESFVKGLEIKTTNLTLKFATFETPIKAQMNFLKKLLLFILVSSISFPVFSQYKTIRFLVRDSYDETPIAGARIKPNLFGDSLVSNKNGVIKLKVETKCFDTVCVMAKGYYPLSVKIGKGMEWPIRPFTYISFRGHLQLIPC